MYKINGFTFSSINSKVKRKRRDLCLVKCEKGSIIAGTLTQNISRAAPVLYTEKVLKDGYVDAIVINSGNANACTGELGYKNCEIIANKTSELLNIDIDKVVISSTGIIGKQLEMDKIIPSLEILKNNLNEDNIDLLPEGIMTTDTFEKTISKKVYIDNEEITISAFAKGSGMIHPNMATMLAFIFTDANIEQNSLNKLIKDVVDDTFNMISVDGDTSTNDMVLIASSLKAKNNIITFSSDSYILFKKQIFEILKYLSIEIAKDGEGATKLLTANVYNSNTKKNAKLLAKAVISSNLVKSAFFGNDPNWGRIICAMGYSGGKFVPNKVDLSFKSSFGEVFLLKNGVKTDYNEEYAKKVIEENQIFININLNEGNFSATAWGCDLTYDYVKINAEYTT